MRARLSTVLFLGSALTGTMACAPRGGLCPGAGAIAVGLPSLADEVLYGPIRFSLSSTGFWVVASALVLPDLTGSTTWTEVQCDGSSSGWTTALDGEGSLNVVGSADHALVLAAGPSQTTSQVFDAAGGATGVPVPFDPDDGQPRLDTWHAAPDGWIGLSHGSTNLQRVVGVDAQGAHVGEIARVEFPEDGGWYDFTGIAVGGPAEDLTVYRTRWRREGEEVSPTETEAVVVSTGDITRQSMPGPAYFVGDERTDLYALTSTEGAVLFDRGGQVAEIELTITALARDGDAIWLAADSGLYWLSEPDSEPELIEAAQPAVPIQIIPIRSGRAATLWVSDWNVVSTSVTWPWIQFYKR